MAAPAPPHHLFWGRSVSPGMRVQLQVFHPFPVWDSRERSHSVLLQLPSLSAITNPLIHTLQDTRTIAIKLANGAERGKHVNMIQTQAEVTKIQLSSNFFSSFPWLMFPQSYCLELPVHSHPSFPSAAFPPWKIPTTSCCSWRKELNCWRFCPGEF